MGWSFKSIFKEELHSNRFFKLPQWQRILSCNRVVILMMQVSTSAITRSDFYLAAAQSPIANPVNLVNPV
jgi:hypothetical protein